jgi:hypothetical protein
VNSLGSNIEKKIVVLHGLEDVRHRLFCVLGGFGAYAETLGTQCYGYYICSNRKGTISGMNIVRLATKEDLIYDT